MKNTPGAIEGYRRFLEKYPDDRDAKMELARLLATADKYDESIELYQDVLKANPDDPAALDKMLVGALPNEFLTAVSASVTNNNFTEGLRDKAVVEQLQALSDEEERHVLDAVARYQPATFKQA